MLFQTAHFCMRTLVYHEEYRHYNRWVHHLNSSLFLLSTPFLLSFASPSHLFIPFSHLSVVYQETTTIHGEILYVCDCTNGTVQSSSLSSSRSLFSLSMPLRLVAVVILQVQRDTSLIPSKQLTPLHTNSRCSLLFSHNLSTSQISHEKEAFLDLVFT